MSTAHVDPKKRLAELREQEAKFQAQEASAAEARELQELELVVRFRQELGARGVEFELLSSKADGPIVIRRGEEVLYRRFKAIVDSGKPVTPEDYYGYVAPCVVFPEKEKFDQIIAQRPHITVRLATAMLALHGAKEASDAGKF